MIRYALIAMVLVAGCAGGSYTGNSIADTILGGGRAAARQFPVGDGRTGWEVTCDGARTMGACYQRAAHYCPSGFDVLDASQGVSDTTQQRSLMFTCKT